MNIKPICDKIVVQVVKEERKSGLIIPEDKKGKKLERVKIIECGPEVINEVKNSSIAYIDHFAGTPVSVNNEPYLMIKEEDIHAIE